MTYRLTPVRQVFLSATFFPILPLIYPAYRLGRVVHLPQAEADLTLLFDRPLPLSHFQIP
jgi:hypothetical protein